MIEFYNRSAYWLFILEIPHVRGKELMSAVKFKLSSLYPGNADDCNIQILKNGAKKWSYLIFVLEKNTGSAMLPLSPLFAKYACAQKTANVLYIDEQWLDYVCIENGTIKSSTVKNRKEFRLFDDVKELCGAETDLLIYCNEADKASLTPFKDDNVQFLDSATELNKIDAHKISLFSEKSPVVKRRKILLSAIMLFLLCLGSWLFYQHRLSEKEHNARLQIEQEQLKKAVLEQQREQQRLSELASRYREMISSKAATPYDIAVVISECVNQQTRIQSATFNGNFFQIEGITDNSLSLLHMFETHRLASNARLHQVHPANNRDAFTLSGVIQHRAEVIDELLPANEQIIILENLIAAETYYDSSDARLSPSAFGEAVKALFEKWGCAVNSYQFMNNSQETEVEYSLRGAGSGFFNALYEIKTKHRLWDVRLTQIRNLYPRNALDIVIRIKTEYHYPNGSGINAAPAETASPFPISNISRNYFRPAPAPRPAEKAIAAEVPVAMPSKAEKVSWLEYVGSINDDGNVKFIYVKNTKTGSILKLGNFGEGNMRYVSSPSGSIIVYIDNNIYEINRR